MKSRKSEKIKESATLSGIIGASMRHVSVPYITHDSAPCIITYFTPKCTVTRWRGTVFVHQFQLMTLERFQAVNLEAPSYEVWRLQMPSWGECSDLGR